MRIRLAKKIWKRPWRYSPGKLRLAARRLGLERLLDLMIDAFESEFWNYPRIEMSLSNPLGARYWFNKEIPDARST